MTYDPDEINATLQQLKQEVRSRRLGHESSQSSEMATALARVRLTSWVNPHQPIAWPHWPSGLWPKVVAFVQKVVRRVLRWYINPLIEEQNRFNAAIEEALEVLVAENNRLRAELRLLSASQTDERRDASSFDQANDTSRQI